MARRKPTVSTISMADSYPAAGGDDSSTDEPTTGFTGKLNNVSIVVKGSTDVEAETLGGTSTTAVALVEYTTNGGSGWSTLSTSRSRATDLVDGGGSETDSETGPWSVSLGDVADISQLGIRGYTSGEFIGGGTSTADANVAVTNWYLQYDQVGGIVGA